MYVSHFQKVYVSFKINLESVMFEGIGPFR